MFGSAKPLASLSSGLLARKGGARPAMRPQGYASLAPTAQQLDDLGWNDMGSEPEPEPVDAPESPVAIAKPPVLVEREALAQIIATPVEPVEPVETVDAAELAIVPQAVRSVSVATATRLSRETAHKGRAAFTLRLDAERHLKLRLASALAHQSAQQLVAHALDRFLDTMPEVAALAGQLPPQKLTRSKGKRSS
ncbi:MAG: hypothetical protein JWN21_809 [Sphingomonas bacterium]|uniref:hypothetical protein n=1 Tax=Sphingomonas bacterium TaxID=1895847 RepID=UPI00261B5592|nr:hypothetical protein [Sphingomonas bacterium]MDB5695266.1 hypothetical protein [Sphingomonas bacterium]